METSTMLVELGPMHTVLAAAGRSPEIPEEMDVYGWLIGSWELDVVGYKDNGNVSHTTGEAHFRVLEVRGCRRIHRPFGQTGRAHQSLPTGSARRFASTIRPFGPE
jgi:hypothetical protein